MAAKYTGGPGLSPPITQRPPPHPAGGRPGTAPGPDFGVGIPITSRHTHIANRGAHDEGRIPKMAKIA